MKAGIHPDYDLAIVRCSCGNEFQTRSTRPELHVEICSECHPFYTGSRSSSTPEGVSSGSSAGWRRPAAPARASYLDMSNAPDRRPGRPRRRDDARAVELGACGPQAERRDRRGQPADPLGDDAALVLPAPDRARHHRARRVARDRFPRARHLRELRRAGGGRGRRRGRDRALARRAHLRVRDRDRLRAHALQGDAGADHELASRSTPPAGSCSSRA